MKLLNMKVDYAWSSFSDVVWINNLIKKGRINYETKYAKKIYNIIILYEALVNIPYWYKFCIVRNRRISVIIPIIILFKNYYRKYSI